MMMGEAIRFRARLSRWLHRLAAALERTDRAAPPPPNGAALARLRARHPDAPEIWLRRAAGMTQVLETSNDVASAVTRERRIADDAPERHGGRAIAIAPPRRAASPDRGASPSPDTLRRPDPFEDDPPRSAISFTRGAASAPHGGAGAVQFSLSRISRPRLTQTPSVRPAVRPDAPTPDRSDAPPPGERVDGAQTGPAMPPAHQVGSIGRTVRVVPSDPSRRSAAPATPTQRTTRNDPNRREAPPVPATITAAQSLPGNDPPGDAATHAPARRASVAASGVQAAAQHRRPATIAAWPALPSDASRLGSARPTDVACAMPEPEEPPVWNAWRF